MPSEYQPVEIKAVQWAKLYAKIEPHGTKGIALFDLATDMGLKIDDPAFQKGVDHLLRQGRVKVAMGRSRGGMPARVVWAVGDTEDLTKREKTGKREPGEQETTVTLEQSFEPEPRG